MAVTADNIMDSDGHHLPLARDLREAVVLYLKKAYPINTTLHISNLMDVDKPTAKNLLKGHASDATITKVLRAGGWEMAMAVLGSVIGHSLDQHITKKAIEHEQRAQRQREVARQLRAFSDRVDSPGPELRFRRGGGPDVMDGEQSR